MKRNSLSAYDLLTEFVIRWFFPFAYAITVMPFTVQFFKKFVTGISNDMLLFNFIRLSEAHDWGLPIFVFIIELISVKLSIGLWLSLSNKDWGAIPAIGVSFLLLQSFPTVSTYFDARIKEFDQKKGDATYAKELSLWEEEKRRIDLQFDQDKLQRQQEDILKDNKIKSIQQQADSIRQDIKVIEDRIKELTNLINRAIDLNARKTSEEELSRKQKNLADLRAEQLKIENSFTLLITGASNSISRPPYPPKPKLNDILPENSGRNFSEIEYVLATRNEEKSIVTLFVSLIFPFSVIGAGYVLSRRLINLAFKRQQNLIENQPQLNLIKELKECEKLPLQAQTTYANGLLGVVSAWGSALRSTAQLSVANSLFHLESEIEMLILEEASALNKQVNSSNVSATAKNIIQKHIDSVLIPFSPKNQQDNYE